MGKCFQRIGNYSFFVWSVLFFAMCLCVGFKGVVNATQYYSETESKETEDDKVEMEENVEQMENDYYKDFYDNVEMDEISRGLQEILSGGIKFNRSILLIASSLSSLCLNILFLLHHQ